jgi:putative transposase
VDVPIRRFTSIEEARAHSRAFFWWYNEEHYQSGVGWHHPADVHYGRVGGVYQARAEVLAAGYARHPHRFVHRRPTPPVVPTTVWINLPLDEDTTMPG